MTARLTAGVQVVDGGLHALPDRAELVVDGDADGLKAALGRMLLFSQARWAAWPSG